MRVVAALGGHALLRRNEPAQIELLRTHARATAKALASIAREHELVLTFGHGPEVAVASDIAPAAGLSVDILAAGVAGVVGYVLAQELANELGEGEAAFLLAQTRVDHGDPAFMHPTTPLARTDTGRVVACPEPRAVEELRAIEALLEAHIAVITAGAGGVPVARGGAGRLEGVDAIVDRDLVSALLATDLEADVLVMLAGVHALDINWGTGAEFALKETTPGALRTVMFELAQGTITPMVEAACRFVEQTGGRAAIGALEDAEAVIHGHAGTQIVDEIGRADGVATR
jgi:carbamate kinase